MDTDEHRLLRRIEELAAQAGGDDAPEGPVLAAALADLRAEIGSLRADLTSLRADLATVRTSVDANIGKLAGDVAATRHHVSDNSSRQTALTDRLDGMSEVLDEVAAAVPDLRGDLSRLPEGTAALETDLHRLEETLLTRVDTAVGDLRRTVSTGLTQASAGGRAAEAAANETRSVLEERLAAVEDSIDGLAEGLEAVTRDSIGTATEHIRAVDRNLGSLGESLNEAVTGGHGATRDHVESTAMQLRDTVEGAFAVLDSRLSRDREGTEGALASLSGFLEAFQQNTETRLEELETAIAGGLTDAREAMLAEIAPAIDQLTEANGDTRRLLEEEVSALRGDLADALEEVRDRISTLLTTSSESITGALEEQRTSFTETGRMLREDVLDRVEESRADVLSSLDELRAGVSSAVRAGEDTGGRLRELAEVIGSLYATIGELRIEWDARSEAAVVSAREAAEAATAEFRAEVDVMMANARGAMDRQTASVDETAATLNGGVARLVTAGESLLGYLATRDQLLEQERDRVLHDALDAFAAGLSAKERRATAARLSDVIDRRRDSRHADRWRRAAAGTPPVEIPTPPEDLAALAEQVRPRGIRGSAQRRTAAAEAQAEWGAASAPAAAETPRKAPAKRPAAPARRVAATSARSTAKSPAKSAVKRTAKTATKRTATTAAKRTGKTTPTPPVGSSAKAEKAPAKVAATSRRPRGEGPGEGRPPPGGGKPRPGGRGPPRRSLRPPAGAGPRSARCRSCRAPTSPSTPPLVRPRDRAARPRRIARRAFRTSTRRQRPSPPAMRWLRTSAQRSRPHPTPRRNPPPAPLPTPLSMRLRPLRRSHRPRRLQPPAKSQTRSQTTRRTSRTRTTTRPRHCRRSRGGTRPGAGVTGRTAES